MAEQTRPQPREYRWQESGITLVELLVSLVITAFLATAVFTFFLDTSRGISQQSAQGEMWQRGRAAMAIMRQAIESSGFGLPAAKACPGGITGIGNTGTAATLLAITASVQSSGSSYDPSAPALGGIPTYAFSVLIGGGSFGGAPVTTVTNGAGNPLTVANTAALVPGDIAIIAPQGGGTCQIGQITQVAGNSLGSGCSPSTATTNSGPGSVTMAAGPSSCFQASAQQLFPLGSGSVTAASMSNANLYDLGSQNFLFEQFQILENPAGSTPTLYMTQYTGLQGTPPTSEPLASGVVDLQVQYFTSTNPAAPTPPAALTSSDTIVSVQIAMLIRGTQYLPNSLSPATFNVLGQTYTVPTSGGPGCVQGNCRHYEYHLFQSIIPVRNGIWSTQ
jgi:type IV pilus assembly protein PilW